MEKLAVSVALAIGYQVIYFKATQKVPGLFHSIVVGSIMGLALGLLT